MLKNLLGLSDDGVRELKRGIAATAISNLAIMAPVSLLMMVTMALLDKICGGEGFTLRSDVILLMAIGLCGIIFLTQWVQYHLTYTVAYRESANRRITLAEKLRRLPLSFFGQRDLSDLTSTMMGDCSKLERIFSTAVPCGFRLPALCRLAYGTLHCPSRSCCRCDCICRKKDAAECGGKELRCLSCRL